MMTIGFDKPLYVLPFDHRGSSQTKMFGWHGALVPEQTAQIAAAKKVIYDGFTAARSEGVPPEKAGILVDEQFGSAILRDAVAGSRPAASFWAAARTKRKCIVVVVRDSSGGCRLYRVCRRSHGLLGSPGGLVGNKNYAGSRRS